MRNMFESEETFMAYAEIDYLLFCLKQMNEEYLAADRELSPIDREIHRVTGYESNQAVKHYSEIVEIMKTIRDKKKFLEFDVTKTEEAIAAMESILLKKQTP